MKASITILICALNEEKNLGQLLEILSHQIAKKIIITNIIVVSDSSTDETDKIVENYMRKDPRFILIRNNERKGKPFSFNLGKESVSSDFILSLDADVILHDSMFVSKLVAISNKNNADLVGAEVIPLFKGNSVASRASYASYSIVKSLKNSLNGGDNFLAAHGRAVLLSKRLYTRISLPNSAGTDQFMYLSAKTNGYNFSRCIDAKVYYFPPNSISDYLKQNIRFQNATSRMRSQFKESIIKNYTYIPPKLIYKTLLYEFFNSPINTAAWILLFGLGKIISIKTKKSASGNWSVGLSTKS